MYAFYDSLEFSLVNGTARTGFFFLSIFLHIVLSQQEAKKRKISAKSGQGIANKPQMNSD